MLFCLEKIYFLYYFGYIKKFPFLIPGFLRLLNEENSIAMQIKVK